MDAIRLQFQRWHDAYPDLRVEVLEAQANDDKVMVWVHLSGQGVGSGVPIEMELAHVVALRERRIAYVAEFFDRAEALEHIGL
jgi:ketosteroid isomerase-like protein